MTGANGFVGKALFTELSERGFVVRAAMHKASSMVEKIVVVTSGTITEESSILNFPAVTIRQAHERPEGMDEGTLIMCGLEAKKVIESIQVVTGQYSKNKRQFKLIQDYDVENVSKKVLRVILSYTDYVNRVIWKKH
jgi:UDP-N-acetylglucosamine 2-epimerase